MTVDIENLCLRTSGNCLSSTLASISNVAILLPFSISLVIYELPNAPLFSSLLTVTLTLGALRISNTYDDTVTLASNVVCLAIPMLLSLPIAFAIFLKI